MRVLGVRLSGGTAWLAIVEEGSARAEPDRFELTSDPRPDALLTGVERAELLLTKDGIEAVAVLDAQSSAKPGSYKEARRRLTLELVLEIGAAKADVPYTLISPQAVQGTLGLPTRKIQDHVDSVIRRAGTRWNERGPAAVAAVAVILKGKN